jgi:magnesium transporter
MLTCFIKRSDGQTDTVADAKGIAAAFRDPMAVFWLDMFQPTEHEIALLDEVFAFHPLAIEDTINAIQRPKIEGYSHAAASEHGPAEDYFYMVIHEPPAEPSKEDEPISARVRELDMFLSPRYLVTVHDQKLTSIDQVLGRCKADSKLILDAGIDRLLHEIIDRLVDLYQPILDRLQEELDALEDKAVDSPTPDILPRLSAFKRQILLLRRIVGPQREVVAQLTRGEIPFIRESTRVYFRDVQDHLVRAVESMEIYRDLVLGARDIYMSSINNNLNQIMKTLTIISVIALPMTVVTSFFGMNFESIQQLHSPRTFWVAMAVTVAMIVGLLYVFRIKRWL